MPDITQEKAREYRQVASILAFDIDLLVDMVKEGQGYDTVKDFRRVIKWLERRKDRVINDKEWRDSRMRGLGVVQLVVSGAVLDDGTPKKE